MARMVNPSSQAGVDAPAFNWQPYLGRHERLIWQGQREGGFSLSGTSLFHLIFFIAWTAFAIFWTSAAAFANIFFAAFGLIFVAIGVINLAQIFRQSGLIGATPQYALTDRRALISTGGNMQSVPITNTLQMHVKHGADYDDIIFENHNYLDNSQPNPKWDMDFNVVRNAPKTAFLRIENGQEVYQKILDIQSNLVAPPQSTMEVSTP